MHKVEMRHQENGEAEEELVVSNLRPFTLKVPVPSPAAHRLRTARCVRILRTRPFGLLYARLASRVCIHRANPRANPRAGWCA